MFSEDRLFLVGCGRVTSEPGVLPDVAPRLPLVRGSNAVLFVSPILKTHSFGLCFKFHNLFTEQL